MNAGPPSRGAAPAAPPRHPAHSHPGFEAEERPTHGSAPLLQVLGAVNAGFRQLADLMALHAELTTLREQHLTTQHALDIERLERKALAERVRELEKDVEDTGQHRQKDIDRELERMRGAQAHWVRYVVSAVAAAILTLLITTLTRRL